ncbi:hypothetical protein CRM22_001605 [Opisthorchis felineus]|uniref:Selenoprotein S n=1 Tax=Opisthorchis felineus TaxID=147828 RepID=A0A4S2MGC1_OPIFE|nr:hypothetical protein CRM22_001605 [Opisthorchis felineus]
MHNSFLSRSDVHFRRVPGTYANITALLFPALAHPCIVVSGERFRWYTQLTFFILMDAFVETEDGFDGGETDAVDVANTQPVFLRIGGLLVVALTLIYLLLKKFYNSSSTDAAEVLSSDVEVRRREAIEAARMKLQERFNEDVLRYKAKQIELKKAQTERKTEEWESMMSGTSCPSRQKHNKAGDGDDEQPECRRPKPKVRLRDDYNPLTDGGSGSCYRPTSRFGGGGG